MYIGTSGWGWNASLAVHSRMVCSPPGFVRRKIPNLQRSAGYIHVRTTEAHGREVRGEGLLRGRSGCADDRERFGQHALEAGVRVEIHRGHEAYEFDLTSATLGHTSY